MLIKEFVKEIISGGQTGVDRAALDLAIALDIPHGGWCSYGRKAEDGIISRKYNLKETELPTSEELQDNPDAIYKKRTELNARDSDGTLIIIKDDPIGGTLNTIEILEKYKKPYLIYNLSNDSGISDVANWIVNNNIRRLNVAGPRESQTPGIYDLAYDVLHQLLKQ